MKQCGYCEGRGYIEIDWHGTTRACKYCDEGKRLKKKRDELDEMFNTFA